MRQIKFRYVWKRKNDGKVWIEIVPLGCLEHRGDTPFVHQDNSLWEMIARDEWTGFVDRGGVDVYEHDIVTAEFKENQEVVFGPIGYDGSRNGLTGFEFRSNMQDGFLELDYYNDPTKWHVVGNIYENPELLQPPTTKKQMAV